MTPSKDWIEDCLHWRKRVLTGAFAHWCSDWDLLPVDETTTDEWDCCCCFSMTERDRGSPDPIPGPVEEDRNREEIP
jgi:hypothetical protein